MTIQTTPSQGGAALLTEAEAASILRIAPATLRDQRLRHRPHPDYIRIGPLIRYSREAVAGFIEANAVKGIAS